MVKKRRSYKNGLIIYGLGDLCGDFIYKKSFDSKKSLSLLLNTNNGSVTNINLSKKFQYLEPVLTVSTIKKFQEIFRKSLVLELSWENKIDYKILDIDTNRFQKYSIFTLFRKYISKRIRMIFK